MQGFKQGASALVMLALPIGVARAGEIHVAPPPVGAANNPGTPEAPLSSIQLAVIQAQPGDTVLVAEGSYNESVAIGGKDINLSSHDPLDGGVVARTVIDGSGMTFAGILFDGSESAACKVTGFTIRNFGFSARGGGISGGTEAEHCQATISHNVIEDNHATLYGGGICYCDGEIRANRIRNNGSYDGGGLAYCDGTISGNRIESNYADYAGGGLFDCDGVIADNVIIGNYFFNGVTVGGGAGGGMSHCSARIEHNDILGNEADYGGGVANCSGIILRNRIYKNQAREVGGGVAQCSAALLSNLVVYNQVAGHGGGIATCGGSVCNNTVLHNGAGIDGGGLFLCDGTVANNIVYSNVGGANPQMLDCAEPDHCCVAGWSGGGAGTISASPQFADPDGADDVASTVADNDYRLLASSPCIDSGTNAPLTPPECDCEGLLRIVRHSAASPVVDMGAHEFRSRPLRIRQWGKTDFPSPGRYFTFDSQPNDTYALWSSYGLGGGNWTKIRTVSSAGETTTITEHTLVPIGIRRRFFRVSMEPAPP